MAQRKIKRLFEMSEYVDERLNLILDSLKSMSDDMDCNFSIRKLALCADLAVEIYDWEIRIQNEKSLIDGNVYFFGESDTSLTDQLNRYISLRDLEIKTLKLATESVIRSGVKYKKLSIKYSSGGVFIMISFNKK